ncbi:MAG: carboxymuconolactone decarboxylase family protein [Actinomycetota bacterium]|nr:carboxymuconolactone decarboxylase family protein [Actinomycetota bacterium]
MSDHHDAAGRLRPQRPDELDDAQRALYNAIAGGPRAGGPFRVTDDDGRLLGPFDALLLRPGIGDAVQRLGAALRFQGDLPPRTRELVVCAVAADWRSAYEWYAHSLVALAVGCTREELDGVRTHVVPATLTPAEAAALRLTRALLRDRVVDDELYAEVLAHHGTAGVLEITVLVGYYQALAGLLEAFAVAAPEPTPFDRDQTATSGTTSRAIAGAGTLD